MSDVEYKVYDLESGDLVNQSLADQLNNLKEGESLETDLWARQFYDGFKVEGLDFPEYGLIVKNLGDGLYSIEPGLHSEDKSKRMRFQLEAGEEWTMIEDSIGEPFATARTQIPPGSVRLSNNYPARNRRKGGEDY